MTKQEVEIARTMKRAQDIKGAGRRKMTKATSQVRKFYKNSYLNKAISN